MVTGACSALEAPKPALVAMLRDPLGPSAQRPVCAAAERAGLSLVTRRHFELNSNAVAYPRQNWIRCCTPSFCGAMYSSAGPAGGSPRRSDPVQPWRGGGSQSEWAEAGQSPVLLKGVAVCLVNLADCRGLRYDASIPAEA